MKNKKINKLKIKIAAKASLENYQSRLISLGNIGSEEDIKKDEDELLDKHLIYKDYQEHQKLKNIPKNCISNF
jgi:hypothetical protein